MGRKRILVADDDLTVLGFYTELLTEEGYEVIKATNGREALDKIEAKKPDLAVLDIRMPVMDGLEALKKLARKGDPTPVLVTTAYGELKDDLEISYGEVQAFLNKPVHPQELTEAVRKALGIGERVGTLLQRYGLVDEDQVREALAAQKEEPHKKIGEILIEMGVFEPRQWLNFIARLPGVARISLEKYLIDPEIVKLVPEAFCRRVELVALDRFDSVLTVAMAYPYNLEAIHDLSKKVGLR
jgi:CheY-like chemotaxis protein